MKISKYNNICNKYYKSKNSLGNHNRKFHIKNKSNISHDKQFYKSDISQNGLYKCMDYTSNCLWS